MTQTSQYDFITSGPACLICGDPTRIYGAEPHPRLPQAELRTYVCDSCDLTRVLELPIQNLAS